MGTAGLPTCPRLPRLVKPLQFRDLTEMTWSRVLDPNDIQGFSPFRESSATTVSPTTKSQRRQADVREKYVQEKLLPSATWQQGQAI